MLRTVKKYLRNSALSPALWQNAPRAHLTFDQRRRSRQQLILDNGETVNMIIERGQLLLPGDILVADDGGLITVHAQNEDLIRVTADTPLDLLRAAYHLGNRHVTIEIARDHLQFAHDPVLVDMLHRLGVHTAAIHCPFNPEHGAYGGGHKHGHDETFEEDYELAQAAYHAHDHAHGHNHRDHRSHCYEHEHEHSHEHEREHDLYHNQDHGRKHAHHPLMNDDIADHGHHHK